MPKITYVHILDNSDVMAFDQYGRELPEYQGRFEDAVPKIRKAGYTEEIEGRAWKRRPD